MILNQSRRLDLSETGEAERLLLSFLRGTRRLALRSREREDSEPEFETESESDSLESDAESESEADDSDSDEVLLDLRRMLVKRMRNCEGTVLTSEPSSLEDCLNRLFSASPFPSLWLPKSSLLYRFWMEVRDAPQRRNCNALLFEFLWHLY